MDFHGVNLGRYAHFRRNSRMFLDILELQIKNKKNALGKTVVKMGSQICGKMPSFVTKMTLKKKCTFFQSCFMDKYSHFSKANFFFKVVLWTNNAIFPQIRDHMFKTVFHQKFFCFLFEA